LSNQDYLDSLTESEQINVADFLIAYYNYLLTKEHDNSRYKKLKQKLLVKRFGLPSQEPTELIFTGLSPPHEGDKPSMWFGNYNYQNKQQNFMSIGFSPYALQSLGGNNLNGNELVVLQGELGFTGDSVFLNRFDLIRIKSFDRYHLPLENRLPLSWQLEVVVENVAIANSEYGGYLSGGVGKTWVQNPAVMWYTMINGGLYTYKDTVLITPEIGVRIDLGMAKSLLTAKKAFNLDGKSAGYELDLSALIPAGKDISIYIGMNYLEQYRASIGVQYYY
jgi:hypothetical protein